MISDLKAGMKTGEEGMVGCQGQDPLLGHGALHVVVLDDDVLLQHLNERVKRANKHSDSSMEV